MCCVSVCARERVCMCVVCACVLCACCKCACMLFCACVASHHFLTAYDYDNNYTYILHLQICVTFLLSLLYNIKEIDCGHPGDIDNGNVTFTSTTVGSYATYSCEDGYQLEPYLGYGRSCTQSGNWSGEVPTCAGE